MLGWVVAVVVSAASALNGIADEVQMAHLERRLQNLSIAAEGLAIRVLARHNYEELSDRADAIIDGPSQGPALSAELAELLDTEGYILIIFSGAIVVAFVLLSWFLVTNRRQPMSLTTARMHRRIKTAARVLVATCIGVVVYWWFVFNV